MKLKYLLPLFGLALPLAMQAVPADPTPRVMTNPDGTTVTIRAYGDEYFHYYTDADGVNLLTCEKGYWKPMERAGRVMTASDSDIAFLREEALAKMPAEFYDGSTRMAALDGDGRSTYPCIGQARSLVILVEYSDVKFADYSNARFEVKDVRDEITRKLNEEGYSNFNSVGSVRDYYLACSHGLFDVHFDVSRIVTLPNTSEYYVAADANVPAPGSSGRFTEIIQYAVKELDDEIDFSQYDYDNDGKIDNIFFYYAGYGQADSHIKTTIWPHQSDYSLVVRNVDYYKDLHIEQLIVDGKEMATYACGSELKGSVSQAWQPWLDGIGTFCHEYGHVLGLPDFYDAKVSNSSTETPGDFDIMCSGSYNNGSTQPPLFSAYEKWLCNWIEYETLDFDADSKMYLTKTYDLHSLASSNKAYRINVPNSKGSPYKNEYFIVECRAHESWDASLPDEGLMFWHVRYNKSAWTSNGVNTGNNSRMRIIRPLNAVGNDYCWDDNTPWLIPGTSSSLTPKDVTGVYFLCYITGITYDKETMNASFTVNEVTERPKVDCYLTLDDFWADPDERSLNFSWHPVEGATAYQVTIYRQSASGARTYLANEKVVPADECKFQLRNIETVNWINTLHVYVRPVIVVPSLLTSEEVEFIPKNLPDGAGVDDVMGDAVNIFGGAGFIQAPADAKIFNMNGMNVGRDNLQPGVYVVRSGNVTRKVMVK